MYSEEAEYLLDSEIQCHPSPETRQVGWNLIGKVSFAKEKTLLSHDDWRHPKIFQQSGS